MWCIIDALLFWLWNIRCSRWYLRHFSARAMTFSVYRCFIDIDDTWYIYADYHAIIIWCESGGDILAIIFDIVAETFQVFFDGHFDYERFLSRIDYRWESRCQRCRHFAGRYFRKYFFFFRLMHFRNIDISMTLSSSRDEDVEIFSNIFFKHHFDYRRGISTCQKIYRAHFLITDVPIPSWAGNIFAGQKHRRKHYAIFDFLRREIDYLILPIASSRKHCRYWCNIDAEIRLHAFSVTFRRRLSQTLIFDKHYHHRFWRGRHVAVEMTCTVLMKISHFSFAPNISSHFDYF